MALPLRVGVIGAGTNTLAKHIPGLLTVSNVSITAIANRTRESAVKAAKSARVDSVKLLGEADIAQVFDDESIDAIVIGTWPYKHCDHTLAGLKAGKHVMTEARMAMNAKEAERMLAASREHSHLVTQVVPSPYTLEIDRVVSHLVDNMLGDLLAVEIKHFLASDAQSIAPLSWRHQRRYSGNNIMTLGILYEALMRWTGPAARVDSAQAATLVHLRFDKERMRHVSVDIPDYLTVAATLVEGDVPVSFTMTSTRSSTENGFWLYGSEARIRVMLDGKVWVKPTGQAAWTRVNLEKHATPGWRVEEEFVNAIRGEEEVKLTTFADGVRYMRFTDAVATALVNHQPVAIENEV